MHNKNTINHSSDFNRRADARQRIDRGFTLVEMAIVLVIIGLVVAGVVGGSSLIDNANRHKIVEQYQRYHLATNAFILKYDYPPGDLPVARSYWPSQCLNNGVSNMCNGNGDNAIHFGWTQADGWNYPAAEAARSWQHLYLAKMVNDGSFSPTAANSNKRTKAGITAPEVDAKTDAGKKNVGFILTSHLGWGGSGRIYLTIGAETTATNAHWSATFTPHSAKLIDIKMDDGSPKTGSLQSVEGHMPGTNVHYPAGQCVVVATQTYNLANDAVRCRTIYWQ